MDENILFSSRGRNHVLKMAKFRMVCTVSSPLTWPSNKKSDGTDEFATTGSVDGCSIRPETHFNGTRLHVDTTQVLSVGAPVPDGS